MHRLAALAGVIAVVFATGGPRAGAAPGAQATGRVTKQFSARDFTIRAEDLDLTLRDGSVFTIEEHGATALVLFGRGTMRFSPAPESEKSQVRIFSGGTVLETPFDTALVRMGDISSHAVLSRLEARPPDARDVRRAEDVFEEELRKTSATTVGNATDGSSMVVGPSDFVADVRTRRFGTLTYLQAAAAPEDILVFARATRKTIAVYSSNSRIAATGRFYHEEDLTDYDVLHHDLDLSFDPERWWIDGKADMRIRIRSDRVDQLTLRLAESLAVRSITVSGLGPVQAARITGRDTLLLHLPSPLRRDAEVTISVEYGGSIAPPLAEWQMPPASGSPPLQATGRAYLISTYPMWYPRPPYIDYATATMRISVPEPFDCIASGEPTPESPGLTGDAAHRRKVFSFTASQPLRHLAFLVTPFVPVSSTTLALARPDGTATSLRLTMLAGPRKVEDARTLATDAETIVRFYQSLVGDVPYSTLTLAMVEGQIPGGHSVGYFSAVGFPPKGTAPFWRDDPAAFDGYPNFLAAHEIAHQWWGQAVGWDTYHDQWLSEGFAQYFAALYTARYTGDAAFRDVLRHMSRWATGAADEGPLSLGYRLGELRGDDRIFRAFLYNKGPVVLHMLRRFIGDEAFFLGVRRYYEAGRFHKPATSDLRAAMEAASGRSLERFFEDWVYGSAVPRLTFSYRIEPRVGTLGDVVVRLTQTGDVFDVPVTLVLQYADGPPVERVVPLSERSTETRIPLTGRLRSVTISKDDGTLAEIRKG